jgi:hypothetical protein
MGQQHKRDVHDYIQICCPKIPQDFVQISVAALKFYAQAFHNIPSRIQQTDSEPDRGMSVQEQSCAEIPRQSYLIRYFQGSDWK